MFKIKQMKFPILLERKAIVSEIIEGKHPLAPKFLLLLEIDKTLTYPIHTIMRDDYSTITSAIGCAKIIKKLSQHIPKKTRRTNKS